MAFTKCNVPTVIGTLGTTPEQRGLTTQEFKDKFDEMPDKIKQYINDVLTPELDNKFYDNAGAHNSLYRGKLLGNAVTSQQYADIANGTFADMYIGDYWTINDTVYRIAAFDYYLNTGDVSCTAHHAVLVPDYPLYNAQMNPENTTAGGYVGSAMRTTNLEQAKTTIKAAFSGHVLNHRLLLTNSVSNGYATSGAWVYSEVDLMCEHMVYGNGVFSPVSTGSVVPYGHRVDKSQLPLFAFDPTKINIRAAYWLRDVITAFFFASVGNSGGATALYASSSNGVRPAFAIS